MKGELPAWLATLSRHDAKLFDQVTDVQKMVIQEGKLPLKIKTLMMMLGDCFLARPHGVKVLADRARSQGATEEEVVETVQVAYYMGGLAALFPALNAFEVVEL